MIPDITHSSIPRRRAITLMAGAAGVAVLAACGSDSGGVAPTTTAVPADTSTGNTTIGDTVTSETVPENTGTIDTVTCQAPIPEETAGPYPGDGSNGPDALADPAVVREDITGSFGTATGTAQGVPVTLHLTVLGQAKGCSPLVGGAVYVWHADRDGHYSMYTAPEANYLRGVGEADDTGTVSFKTIFPGCYDGRWPHIHFEVYPSLADAQAATNPLVTSQLALPKDACDQAYTSYGYAASITALSHTSLATDMVFRDGVDQQLATVTGSPTDGYVVELTLTV
jgi:protocatechuate 3,4-dioxygenase beta subunit